MPEVCERAVDGRSGMGSAVQVTDRIGHRDTAEGRFGAVEFEEGDLAGGADGDPSYRRPRMADRHSVGLKKPWKPMPEFDVRTGLTDTGSPASTI